MPLSKFRVLTTATATALATMLPLEPSNAQLFGAKTNIDQDDHIAVAAPFGDNNYQLLVIEQQSNQRQCWDEQGSEPVIVDPLLKDFDFTGVCGRATDSNGYSIRVNGQDLDKYNLNVVREENELLLMGKPRIGSSDGESMIIGRTHGLAEGEYLKFDLEPGWSFAKRTYQGRTLSHYYFAKTTVDIPFDDAKQDIYVKEIAEAVSRGFISGFKEDNTFRPKEELTREQLVSIAIESLKTIPELNVTVPEEASSSPYPDVSASRWSAAKIQWARENDIVSGFPDGKFRPAEPVTRAQLIAVENKVAQYARQQLGASSELPTTQQAFNFSDIENHWAQEVITEMSASCRIASPLNEQGNEFVPNQPAKRNYAAAATVRMLNCLEGEQQVSKENEELEDNNQQLEDNNQQLEDNNQQLEDNNQQLEDNNQQLEDNNQQLEDNKDLKNNEKVF